MVAPSTIDELGKAFEAFKAANDAKLAEIEKTGSAAGETVAKVEKANADITALQEKLDTERTALSKRQDELEDRINRNATRGWGEKLDDDFRERYAAWQSAIQGKEVSPADLDLEFINSYRAGFKEYLRTGRTRPLDELSVSIDEDGGYWVDPDTSGRIVEYVRESSPVRRLANVQTISGDKLEGDIDLQQADFGWVGETEARAATSTPQVAEWSIDLREQYAMPQATQRILDFANRNVDAWLTGKVQSRFARGEATGFATGATPKTPRGFLTYAAGTPGDTPATWPFIRQINSGSAAALTADGLIELAFALPNDLAAGAVMGMSRDTERRIRQLKDGNGAYLWQPDFSGGRQSRVCGIPVEEFADMPNVEAGALAIVYANFAEAYQVVDSTTGIRVLRDAVTTKGKVKFYTTRYVGGDVVNFQAIVLQKVSA